MTSNVDDSPFAQEENGNRTQQQSVLACESCRRRKIKCDRHMPRCSICQKSQQTCIYRDGPLKPGPRIGTTQRGRKRQRIHGSHTKSRAGDRDGSLRSEENYNLPSAASMPAKITSPIRNFEDDSPVDDLPNQLPSISGLGSVHEYTALSPATTVSPATPRSAISIHSLSFIMHPSHETTSDTQKTTDQEGGGGENILSDDEPILVARACYALNISPDTLYKLIDLYFDRMTSFSLFRRPYFRAKILSISSSKQLNALLAAMLAFSSRFDDLGQDQSKRNALDSSPLISRSDHFLELAQKFVDEAIQECRDEGPSLCLLQAFTLVTFEQLVRGVHGRAWRSLGTCVRMAYELYFHLIDSENIDRSAPLNEAETGRWCADEEKRRVWWAIWEMDTFASTIRRCPTAIDWSQNETNLPIDDGHWYRGEYQASCFLAPAVMERWKALQSSGNQSPQAWFIVVNSFMREAQLLSSPRGIFRSAAERSRSRANTVFFSERKCKEISQSLAVIENALHCFQLALPPSIKYPGEYLGFASNHAAVEQIQRDSSIYSIHVMMQLTKFMMYHHGVFGGGRRKHCQGESSGDTTPPNRIQPSAMSIFITAPDMEALSRYSDAADKVLLAVNNSSEDHILYVNPFLASTIWLAAAVQLIRKVFSSGQTNTALIDSNFQVLRLNYKQYVDYWKIPTSPQRNLDYLEEQLNRLCTPQINQGSGIEDSNELGAEFGTSSSCANHRVESGFTSYRINSTWQPQGDDSGVHDNRVGASQPYDMLFDGIPLQMGSGDIGGDENFMSMANDPLEVLEGLAFGLEFGMNTNLQGYVT